MNIRSLSSFISYGFGLLFLLGLFFGVLSWFKIPSGEMIDWMIGVVTAWWLFVIVTVPWDVYFEAKGVIDEADRSRAIGITVDEVQQKYVHKVRRIALQASLALHVLSAAGLFALSAFHITPVGYIGSIAALLLTALRPSVRAYGYLWERLKAIKLQVKYPREDVVELRERTKALESHMESVLFQLDAARQGSYAWHQVREVNDIKAKLAAMQASTGDLFDANQRQHEKMIRDSQNAMSKMSADSQFLDNVREIVKLIKSA